jgi:RHS repeat-associated protein
MSNLTGVTDALNRTTNYEYDDFNRLKKIKYPEATAGAGRLEENFTYDLAGNLLEKKDQANRITSFCYDSANRLTTTTDTALNITAYEHNARSQLTAVVDAINQRYEFTYDALGRVTQNKKGTATMSFVYDGAGNRSQRTDYNGAITNYSYDALNRLTTISYLDTTSAIYGYDVLSRLTTATNPTGTVTVGYDTRGRVSSVTDVFGQVVSYQYDANSNRTQLSLNGATNATYQYDVIDRLTQLTDNLSLNTTFAYDATNKITSRTLPNGVVSTWDYDGLNRLTRLKHAKGANTLLDLQYQFNAVNNITQMTDAGAHNYSYDTLDRLTTATHPNQSNESYTLDDVGNRTASHQGSSYSYQTYNRLVSANTSTFGYDTNGNLISKTDGNGNWTYAWDYENRLKQAALSGGVTVTYSYDALGRRTQRLSTVSGTTRFVYDGADVIRDLDGGGSTTAEYLNGPGVDNKLRQTANSTTSYFLADHLGTTRSLTDVSGAITASLSYDSYGNPTSGSASTRYTNTGREADVETGLIYYRARWYSPSEGRFISEDPIGLHGGANLFTYVSNNPLIRSDPSGLCQQTATAPCNVQIQGDRATATVAVALGESTPAYMVNQLPKEQRGGQSRPLTQQDFREEAYYMASVIVNRFNTGNYKSYADVVNEKGIFLGANDGWKRINQLGNNGSEYCERARYIIDALNYLDQQGGPNNDFLFWRGVDQPGGQRAFRQGDQRAANTDFMHMDPTTLTYDRLPYWTPNGWRTPKR